MVILQYIIGKVKISFQEAQGNHYTDLLMRRIKAFPSGPQTATIQNERVS